jgi:hypothetical protein
MIPTRVVSVFCLVVVLFSFVKPAAAENYPVILRGKVVMPDGTPPPITVAVERICSDEQGSRPGPLTNKKGEYLWRMDVDPMRTRSCVIRATHAGYTSTSIDISALHGYLDTDINLEPIVLTSLTADPYAIIIAESKVPSRARKAFKAAKKAMDQNDYSSARLKIRGRLARSRGLVGSRRRTEGSPGSVRTRN